MSNKSLQERKDKAFARGQGTMTHVYIEKALNAELWDVEGNRYIDLGSGIAVLNTGHNHPKVQAAAKDQLENRLNLKRESASSAPATRARPEGSPATSSTSTSSGVIGGRSPIPIHSAGGAS